ncbi:MAG: hypothetical protein RMK94_07350 [Armatimonadota bacterium]|nr:hypothetical protein [Armatimonadota bacterium]
MIQGIESIWASEFDILDGKFKVCALCYKFIGAGLAMLLALASD